MKPEELVQPMADALAVSIKEEPIEAESPSEINHFLTELATRTIEIIRLPEGEERDKLMAEHRGTFRVLAEKHRIELAERANEKLDRGVEISMAFATRLLNSVL